MVLKGKNVELSKNGLQGAPTDEQAVFRDDRWEGLIYGAVLVGFMLLMLILQSLFS